MKHSRSAASVIVAVNVILAGLTAGVVGPAAFKLEQFGLIGWVARVPFYLMPAYLAPLVLWTRPAPWIGACLGCLVGLPLILWSIAAHCPPSVPATYLVSCTAQGLIFSWVVRGIKSSPGSHGEAV